MRTIVIGLLFALPATAQEDTGNEVFDLLLRQYDKNKDGKITKEEYPRGEERFQRLDRNRDGVLTLEDFKTAPGERGRRPGQQGRQRRERPRAPEAGKRAPDFTLPVKADPKKTETLSSYRGKKPVALIFGSYT